MNEGLDQIRSLLDSIEKVGASSVQVAQVGQALADMATSLSAVAQAQERPPEWVGALIDAIKGLTIVMPEINLPAPVVNLPQINVQPAEVSFPPMPSPVAAQMPLMSSGVRMRVTKRDDLGRLAFKHSC
jgi:hypothetical protein